VATISFSTSGQVNVEGRSVGAGFRGPNSGVLAFTGLAPRVTNVLISFAAAGALSLVGQNTTVRFIGPESGAVTYTGYAPIVQSVFKTIPIPKGTLTYTSSAPVVDSIFKTIIVPKGTIALTSTALTVKRGTEIAVPQGTLNIVGRNVDVSFMGPEVGALTYTGLTPAVLKKFETIAVPKGTVTYTGTISGISKGTVIIAVPKGTLAYTSQDIAVWFIGPEIGRVTYTGLALSIGSTGKVISPAKGTLALTGRAANLVLSPVIVSIPAGTLRHTGRVASLNFVPKISIPKGTLALSGQSPEVRFNYVVTNGLQKRYEVILEGDTNWTNITDDVVQGTVLVSGINGNGPLDIIAGTGSFQFILRNDARGSKPLGWYSPNSPNVRPGWNFNIRFRYILGFENQTKIRFTGRIRSILPDTGPRGRRQVEVIAYDVMRDLAEANIQEVDLQVNKNESEVITAVLDAVVPEKQPVARDIDTGTDALAYALYDIAADTTALTPIARAARSNHMFVAVRGDGTFFTRNRHTRLSGTSQYFFNGDANDVVVPSDLSNIASVVRTTTHPMTVDDTPIVLFAFTGDPIAVSPGKTVSIIGTYGDSDNAQRIIGGFDFVEELGSIGVPGVDYDAYADTKGATKITYAVSVTIEAWATAAKFTITNNSGFIAYMINALGEPFLQVRGRAIRDLGPRTVESASSTVGTPMEIDLEYQSNPYVGDAIGNLLFAQRKADNLPFQVKTLSFFANRSSAKMLLAIFAEPGDRIQLSETVTGLNATTQVIQSVTHEESEGVLYCTFELTQGYSFSAWQVGVVGRSEVGQTTLIGA